MSLIRYAEAFPSQISAALSQGAPVVAPIGALEWHGDHLPLGLDLLVADWVSEQLAEKTSGVLLPASLVSITTLPHPLSLDAPEGAAVEVHERMVSQLARAGATKILLLTGHYAQGHVMELYRLCLRAMETHPNLLCLAGSPLELLGDEDLLDHAGFWEASQLLAIRPDLVRLEECTEPETPIHSAVLGKSPVDATAEQGSAVLARGLEEWEKALGWTPSQAKAWLESRIERYRPYEEAYKKTTWEEAILSWWQTQEARA